MSGAHKTDILRTFYVTTARDLAPELKNKGIFFYVLCHYTLVCIYININDFHLCIYINTK